MATVTRPQITITPAGNPVAPTALTGGIEESQDRFLKELENAGIIQNQSIFQKQLQDRITGVTPSIAETQLAETTGKNIANQAALMSGVRGASANPGLVARQIAIQGANIQQDAVARAATLRAQEVSEAQQLLGASLSDQLNARQRTVTGAASVAADIERTTKMSTIERARLAQDQAQFEEKIRMAKTAEERARAEAEYAGWLSAIGAGVGLIAGGGPTGAAVGSQIGGAIGGSTNRYPAGTGYPAKSYNDGGIVKDSAPNRSVMWQYLNGDNMSSGGMVSGKALVPGDSHQNDTVPAMLSPGEAVVPRTVVGDEAKTAAFLNAILGFNLKPGGAK